MEALQGVLERMAAQLELQHQQQVERMAAFEKLMVEQARVTHERVNGLQNFLETTGRPAATPTATPTGA